MPIDPEKIKELSRIASHVGPEAVYSRRLLAGGVCALLADRAELIALLKKIEWEGSGDFSNCPECGGLSHEWEGTDLGTTGHKTDCKLAAFLKDPTC